LAAAKQVGAVKNSKATIEGRANGAAGHPLLHKETTNMTRRFEFVGGSSAKFWEVSTSDKEVTVRFGRLGTDGQTQTKEFPDTAAAQRHVDKLIAQKTGKGYVECAVC
jgi:predicted DNA-binding WGR domain protein